MLELVNLSNYRSDNALIDSSADGLQMFLRQNHLDGVEMLLYEPWNEAMHPAGFIHGVHLRFWANWLDFWLGNQLELKTQFESQAALKAYYGGVTRQEWLEVYRQNILSALETKPKYLVFHISQARPKELFSWQFHYESECVIANVIQVLNELVDSIPADVTLLLENLWWPGLTLCDKALVGKLMREVNHPNLGIMLDTGHLMNTNQQLRTEREGIAYILHSIESLGEDKKWIRGIHLHHSLSGDYVGKMRGNPTARELSPGMIMEHVLKIDQHLPFSVPEAQEIIQAVQPEYLVHEFMQVSKADWQMKLNTQRHALGKFLIKG